MKKLNLDEVLACSLNQIEAKLGVEIIAISRIRKLYGANANSFSIKTINKNQTEQDFFVKFDDHEEINSELNAANLVGKHLPMPLLVLWSTENNPSWICSF